VGGASVGANPQHPPKPQHRALGPQLATTNPGCAEGAQASRHPCQPSEPAALAAQPVSPESAASGHLAQPVTIVPAIGDQQWSIQPVQNHCATLCRP
jgi:hypothetical protein